MEKTGIDILWIIMASALVFIMRAGFAMLETGLTRSKNSINVAVKILTDLGISLAAFWPLGFGLMFGNSILGLFGSNLFLPDFTTVWVTVFFLFHAMFASTAATIVSGAVAERIRYSAYIVITFAFSALVYPIVGHWVWGGSMEGQATGWLVKLGFLDFAGGTVVHSTGGWISLAALFVLGPRIGRYREDGSVNRITGSNLQSSVIGAIILWFGWIGFNGGSTLALNDAVPGIIVRTTLAGAAGLVVTLFVGWRWRGYPDVSLVVNGAIAGLVGVTAACAYVSTAAAVLIGAVSGLIMLFLEWFLDRHQIDDAVTAIPVHLGAGIWGTLAVGIFGDLKLMGTGLDRLHQIAIQGLGIVSVGVFSFGVAFALIKLLNHFHPIRVAAHEEAIGLNVVEHKASTELYDLYRTLEDQARTGDLSLRAPVEPFTEVGQIAERYNALLDSLETNLVARSEYLNILDNVSDGLFLINKELRIGPYYSHALEGIMGESELAGKRFLDILEHRLPSARLEAIKEFLGLMFDAAASSRSLIQLNPLAEAELNIDSQTAGFESHHVQFFFKRIFTDSKIETLMVIVRDISEQKRLALQMKENRDSQRSEMELFSRVIQIEPSLLREFINGFQEGLEAINQILESNSKDYRATLNAIFRQLHLIKGDADTLGLDFVAEKANAMEDRIAEIRSQRALDAQDFLALSISFQELREINERMSAVLTRMASFQDLFAADNLRATGLISSSLMRLANRLSERHGKPLKLDLGGFTEQELPKRLQKPFREILVQLVRNSAAHGIEHPIERRSAGKPEHGRLGISLTKNDSGIALTYADDGSGLNIEAIRKRAIALGKTSQAAAASLGSRELVPLIFQPGFSTSNTSGMSAGRGVGLDAIRDLVKQLGGKISVRNREGVSCEFTIFVPLTEGDKS